MNEDLKYFYVGASPPGVAEHTNSLEGYWEYVQKEFF